MRAASFFAFACLGTCATHAQPTFMRLITAATSYTFDLNVLPSQNIIAPLSQTVLMDPQGHVQHVSVIYSGGTYGVQTLKLVGPNELLFTTATQATTCPSSGTNSLLYPVIGKMDTLGSTQVARKYELNNGICNAGPGRFEVTSDKGVITWGRGKTFYAIRVDSLLEPVWTRKVERSGGFQFIKELPNGDLLAGINMDTAGVVVARMDAEGNFLWSKSYMRPGGMIHDALIESDDSFIITGYTDSTQLLFTEPLPATFQPKLFMMKLDGDGAVQWCKGWYSTPFLWYTGRPSKIRRTLDGQYAVLTTLGAPQNNFHYHPFLMKTDTNGDTLWTRAVGENGYVYIAQDLLSHSDGSYMLSGLIYGDLPGNASKFIYKTDSLGRFDCLEHPNPVQVLDLFPMDSSFTLTSTVSLATATTIMVNDSILDPSNFATYDGCTFTTGLPSMYSRSRPKPTIRPNPNTGRFTMEFPDPLMAESYYGVYDVMGRLLYQRPLPSGKQTEEIDLTRFGAGTYVLKLTDPEGACFERVVVE
ncbi:MAG: T9SS type A sorting domain-containing protein [Flavobacteriales bacterium]